MSDKILVDITCLAALGIGNVELESLLWHELRRLADDVNSGLPDYQVTLVHLDLGNYLSFEKRDPTAQEVAAAESGPPAFCNGPDPEPGPLDPLARAKRDLAALERGEQVDMSAWGVKDLRAG